MICVYKLNFCKFSMISITFIRTIGLMTKYRKIQCSLLPLMPIYQTRILARPIYVRYVHTTTPRKAIPPVILILLRPVVTKIAAVFFGRKFRKWWSNLPHHRRSKLISYIQEHRYLGYGLFVGCGLLSILYYFNHVVINPITKRSQFIIFSSDQVTEIGKKELEAQMYAHGNEVLPKYHPAYEKVAKVTKQILLSNMDVPGVAEQNWNITVVKDSTKNAFVLPNGSIFVYTGMISFCSNEDQLGIVLSHEIAHVLLSHMAEQLSNVHIRELLMVIPLIVIWAIFPDTIAIFSQWLANRLAEVAIHLPFSRNLEAEADEFGLELAAKACYDVREASAFWGKMSILSKAENEEQIDWLSTHPNHEARQYAIDILLPQALGLRNSCKCPKLPKTDPRLAIEVLKKYVADNKIQSTEKK